jgi:hypothetical protein
MLKNLARESEIMVKFSAYPSSNLPKLALIVGADMVLVHQLLARFLDAACRSLTSVSAISRYHFISDSAHQ